MRKSIDEIEYMKIHVPTLRERAAQQGVALTDDVMRLLHDVSIAVQRVHNAATVLRNADRPTRAAERVLGGLLATQRTLRNTVVTGELDELRNLYLSRISAKIAEIRKKLS